MRGSSGQEFIKVYTHRLFAIDLYYMKFGQGFYDLTVFGDGRRRALMVFYGGRFRDVFTFVGTGLYNGVIARSTYLYLYGVVDLYLVRLALIYGRRGITIIYRLGLLGGFIAIFRLLFATRSRQLQDGLFRVSLFYGRGVGEVVKGLSYLFLVPYGVIVSCSALSQLAMFLNG